MPLSRLLPGSFARELLSDGWAGLAAAAVVLTQAIAFGVNLYAPYTGSSAVGALAGLAAVVWLCACSTVAGGTSGLVSAPTGPMLVLLVAITSTLARNGLEGIAVVHALSLVLVIAGIFQALIGLTGGGQLVKLIPVSVIAGFMTGSGILMLLAQVDAVTGGGIDQAWSARVWVPALSAIATLAAARLAPRVTARIPGAIVGLLCGALVFHGLFALAAAAPPGDLLVGRLPTLGSLAAPSLEMLRGPMPWAIVIVSAFVLAIFASLDTLLTSVVADTVTGTRHDARRELVGQGAGHVLSGLSGGMAGAGTTAATVLALDAGGRRFVGLWCAASVVVLVVLLDGLTRWLPLSVLSGVIVHVAIDLLEPDIVAWWRRRRTRTDALVALLVTVITVAYDLMLAVGVGMVITALQFLNAQVRMPVVLRRETAQSIRSQRVRPPRERAALDLNGDRVVLYDLRGTLFFATAERLFEQVLPDLDQGRRIVMSLRRVSQVDITGMKLLAQMAARAHRNRGEVFFANVHKRTGLGRKVGRTLRRAGFDAGFRIRTFTSSDVALEHAENELLKELGERVGDPVVELESSELCSALTRDQAVLARRYFSLSAYPAQSVIYAHGEPGGALYVIRRGNVDLRLPTGGRHYTRLARFGAGMVFGEVSFHLGGAHTTDAHATDRCEVFALGHPEFERLSREHPAIALAILETTGALLGRRLRQANREIYQLNQF